jgi:hypothetical protein
VISERWQPAFGDLMLNVGGERPGLRLPEEAIQEFMSVPLSPAAHSRARMAARQYIQSIAAHQQWTSETAAQAVDDLQHSDEWMASAQIADGLLRRYEDAFAAFGDRFVVPASDVIEEQGWDALYLVEASEAARAWQKRKDPGIAHHQQGAALREKRRRADLAKSFRKTSQLIRGRATTLAFIAQKALSIGGLHEPLPLQPSMRLFRALYSLLPQGPRRTADTWALIRSVTPVLISAGIDLQQLDSDFRRAHPVPPRSRFPGREAVSQRLATTLAELGRQLETPWAEGEHVQVGNLMFRCRPKRLPDMPQTGLATELVMLLREMTANPGSWQPVSRIVKGVDHEGDSYYEIAAAFVRCALDCQVSSDAIRKSIDNLITNYPCVYLESWT